jgi:hypothetical protein
LVSVVPQSDIEDAEFPADLKKSRQLRRPFCVRIFSFDGKSHPWNYGQIRIRILPGCGLGRLRIVYGFDAIENLAEIALRDLNVIVVLQIEPKLRRCAERLGELKRSIDAAIVPSIAGTAMQFAAAPYRASGLVQLG